MLQKENALLLPFHREKAETHAPCSTDGTMHYSYDYAQQVHYPSNPMQLGPIQFKTPCKCGIFGIMCEAIPRQVHYLIDEVSSVGKGANLTISIVHHYFTHHGLGETHVHLHADYCSGQKKNNLSYYLLIFNCWSYEICSRSLIRDHKEGLQGELYFFNLQTCSND